MARNILVVAFLSLIVVACGKSDEGAEVENAGKSSLDARHETVSETPTQETAAVSKTAVQAPAQTDIAAAGEAVYKRACAGCHMTGAAGSPRVGDASAWQPRVAKGSAMLVQSATAGVPGTAMMARGTCGTCSDDDIKAAVEYMIAQSR